MRPRCRVSLNRAHSCMMATCEPRQPGGTPATKQPPGVSGGKWPLQNRVEGETLNGKNCRRKTISRQKYWKNKTKWTSGRCKWPGKILDRKPVNSFFRRIHEISREISRFCARMAILFCIINISFEQWDVKKIHVKNRCETPKQIFGHLMEEVGCFWSCLFADKNPDGF